MKSFGELLKEKRLELGLSQRQVAERMNVSQQSIAQYEKAKNQPKMETVRRLANALGILPGNLIINWDQTFNEDFIHKLSNNLTPDEAELLLNYQKLNDLGKDRAREDVADLTEIPKYIADYPDTMAAHFDGEEMTDQQKAAVTRLNEIVKQQKK